MSAGGGKHWASLGGIGSIGAILGDYLPGIMTDAKSWTPFLAISLRDRAFRDKSGAAMAS
jgi:hypothetical protein